MRSADGATAAAALLAGLLAEIEARLAADDWAEEAPAGPEEHPGDIDPAALLQRADRVRAALEDELVRTREALGDVNRRREAASAYGQG